MTNSQRKKTRDNLDAELSNVKVVIIIILHEMKVNTLELNENRSYQQRNRNYKKE